MIRCTSAGSASPAEHGGEEERQRRLVSMRAAEAAPQSGPVWAHSGALMTLPPLANCCVLAARWNVNGSTCDDELRRGAAQRSSAARSPPHPTTVFIWDTTSTFGRVQEGTAVEPRQSISICSRFNVSLFVFTQPASRAGTINPIIQVARRLKRFHGNYLGRGFV